MKLFKLFSKDPEVKDNQLALVDGSILTNDGEKWFIVADKEKKEITPIKALQILEY